MNPVTFDDVIAFDWDQNPQHAAARLVFDLQARGITLACDGGALVVRPIARLTVHDRLTLSFCEAHVLAMLGPRLQVPS